MLDKFCWKKFFKVFLTILLVIVEISGALRVEAANENNGTVVFVPIDNRPISDAYTVDTMEKANFKVLVPPDDILGGPVVNGENTGDADLIWKWLDKTLVENPDTKAAVLSADSLVYGSLVKSRKHELPENVLSERVQKLESFKQKYPNIRLYVFSSVMRTPSFGSNGGTEPDYYQYHGAEIFQYTGLLDKQEVNGKLSKKEKQQLSYLESVIPKDDLQDWLTRRDKNFTVNKKLLSMAGADKFNYLVIGRDDNAPWCQTHREGRKLKKYASDLGLNSLKYSNTSGIDEIGMMLLARAANDLTYAKPFVYADYNAGIGKNMIPAFSDEKIGSTIDEYIKIAGGFQPIKANRADITLLVNTTSDGHNDFAGGAGNTLANENSSAFVDKVVTYTQQKKPFIIADISFYNGSDKAMLNELGKKGLLFDSCLKAYGGWNTATNSAGFALGQGILADKMTDSSRKELLLTRYLDEWAYEAEIRQSLGDKVAALGNLQENIIEAEKIGSGDLRKFAEDNLQPVSNEYEISMQLPWCRLFENKVILKKKERITDD